MAVRIGGLFSNDHGFRRNFSFVFSLSANISHGIREVISSLRPYVLDDNEWTFGAYVNRLFPHPNEIFHLRTSNQMAQSPHGVPTYNVAEQQPEVATRSPLISRTSNQTPEATSYSNNNPRASANNVTINISSDNSPVEQNTESRLYHQLNIPGRIVQQMDVGGTNAAPISRGNRTNNSSSASESESDLEFSNISLALLQYGMFFAIIFAKAIFDRFVGFLVLGNLFAMFYCGDSKLKEWTSTYSHTPLRRTIVFFFTHFMSVFLPYFYCRRENLFYSALLLPPGKNLLHLTDLLWVVLITDYALKMVTLTIKMAITTLPPSVLNRKLKGKYFLIIEMTSQLYRSLATVQPWLSYLLDSYDGSRKIFGIILSASYFLIKGPDIICRGLNLHSTAKKCLLSMVRYKYVCLTATGLCYFPHSSQRDLQPLFHCIYRTQTYGSNPTHEELKAAGHCCPICFDTYLYPIKLACRHIFCENCITTWFYSKSSCPICRAKVAEDPTFRNGGTSHFIQLY